MQQKVGAINRGRLAAPRCRPYHGPEMSPSAAPSQVPGQPPNGARAAYLVLGMHRSGTSAATQLLALAGAQLPANVMPGDEHNAKGYFEPWKIALFNNERLRAAGSAWDDIFAYPYRPLDQADEAAWLARATAVFEDEFGETRNPLLKDPRVTVLMPLWRQVLDGLAVAPRCVIPLRHPMAVAGSLSRRDGFAPQKSVLIWSAYMLAAEAYSRDLPRAVVGYDALLGDWRGQAARIEATHGAPLPRLTERAGREIDRFLTPDLRHNQGDGDLASLGWAGEIAAQIYGWFQAAAEGEAPDRAPLEAAAAALAARQVEFGALVSPATRDLDVTRAELLELRQRSDYERMMAEQQIRAARHQADRLAAQLKALERAWDKADAALDAILAND